MPGDAAGNFHRQAGSRLPGGLDLEPLVAGAAARAIEQLRVPEQDVALAHVVQRHLRGEGVGAQGRAQFHGPKLLRAQIRRGLFTLQTVEFGCLRHAKAVRKAKPGACVADRPPHDAGLGRERPEAVAAVRRAAVAATSETAGRQIVPRASRRQHRAVVVTRTFVTRADARRPVASQTQVQLDKRSQPAGVHVVIVVVPGRKDFPNECAAGRIALLPLAQIALRVLEVEAGNQKPGSTVDVGRRLQARAGMAVALERVAGQEVHPKAHARIAQVRGQDQRPGLVRAIFEARPGAQVERPAEGFGVRVGAGDLPVSITVESGDVARGVLVQPAYRQGAGPDPGSSAARAKGVELELPVAGVVAKAPVAHRGQLQAAVRLAEPVQPEARQTVRPQFEAGKRRLCAARGNDVHHTVQRIASVNCSAGPAQHLDARCRFVVGEEELVDVAKARRRERNAVLGREQSAAGACPGQYRRTQGRQILLPVAPLQVHAGHPHQRLLHVRLSGQSAKALKVQHAEAAAHPLCAGGAPPRGHHDFFDTRVGACVLRGGNGRQKQALGKRKQPWQNGLPIQAGVIQSHKDRFGQAVQSSCSSWRAISSCWISLAPS